MDFKREKRKVEHIKEQYPPGTLGTVEMVDDASKIHMKWSNGRTLALIPGVNIFSVVQPELTTLKLYMPLTVHCYERNEYGDIEDYADDRDGRYALPFKDQILGLIKRFDLPEEAERGLMQWYGEDDSVNKKVLSAHATVEEVSGELMGVMVCRIKGELTTDERSLLDEFVIGQMAGLENFWSSAKSKRMTARFTVPFANGT